MLLVDDLMVCDPPCLKQMVDAYTETGGNIVSVIEVPREHTSRYGVLDIVEDKGRLVRAKGVVEKPAPGEAPSNLTIIGRYIIQPEVFDHLEKTKPGAGNEIQLTDGLAALIADGQDFRWFPRRRAPLRLRRQARLSRSQYRAWPRTSGIGCGSARRAQELSLSARGSWLAMGHRFHPTILREYDIRGIVGATLFAADATALGRAFAATLAEQGKFASRSAMTGA